MKELINISDFSGGIVETPKDHKGFVMIYGFNTRDKPGYVFRVEGFRIVNQVAITNGFKVMATLAEHELNGIYTVSNPIIFSQQHVWVYNEYISDQRYNNFSLGTPGQAIEAVWYEGRIVIFGEASNGNMAYGSYDSFFNQLTYSDTFLEKSDQPEVKPYIALLNNIIYIADRDQISTLDGSTLIQTKGATVLPNNDRVTALYSFNGLLYIGTQQGFIYTWDGVSAGSNSFFHCPGSVLAFSEINNMLLVFSRKNYKESSGVSTGVNSVFYYNGSSITPLLGFPAGYFFYGDKRNVCQYRDGIVVSLYNLVLNEYSLFYIKQNNQGGFSYYMLPKPFEYKSEEILNVHVNKSIGDNTLFVLSRSEISYMEVSFVYGTNQPISIANNPYSLKTSVFDLIDNKGFSTLVKAITFEGTKNTDTVTFSYSIDNGSFSSSITVNFGEIYRINRRCNKFQVDITNLNSNTAFLSAIKIYG